MNSSYILILALLLLFVCIQRRKQRNAAVCTMRNRSREEVLNVEAMARQFVGKKCIIYTIADSTSSVNGVIREVADGAMLVEDSGGFLQAINLAFVTRIREYPRNKKGKEKSVILY